MTTTPLSKRLRLANDKLQLSTRQVVAEAAKGGYEISTYTATQVLNGKHGNVKDSTLEALSYVFKIPFDELAELAGKAPRQGVFQLSPQLEADASTLTRSQAELVYEIIRHLAEGNRQYTYRKHGTIFEPAQLPWNHKRPVADEEVGDDGSSAPNRQAAGSAAEEDPDDFDLAAHPDMVMDRDRFDAEHGNAGEESQER